MPAAEDGLYAEMTMLTTPTAMPGLVHENVLDMVGNTPMVDVSKLSPNPNVRILAKMESQNPFGSVKDRIAKAMIESAEKDGRLLPGQTILEPSSGNTGIALAAIARLKGYPIKIMMPESVSIERRQMLEIMGAEIILTPGPEGSSARLTAPFEPSGPGVRMTSAPMISSIWRRSIETLSGIRILIG